MDLEIEFGKEELPKIEESDIHVAAMTGSNIRPSDDDGNNKNQISDLLMIFSISSGDSGFWVS